MEYVYNVFQPTTVLCIKMINDNVNKYNDDDDDDDDIDDDNDAG